MNVDRNQTIEGRVCPTCQRFSGHEAFQWFCSVCYKNQKKTQKETAITPTLIKEESRTEEKKEPTKAEVPLPVVDKSRCHCCQKKVGLLGVECKCTRVFCNLHRLPEQHECTFDFKKHGKERLQKEHKKVVASKITHI